VTPKSHRQRQRQRVNGGLDSSLDSNSANCILAANCDLAALPAVILMAMPAVILAALPFHASCNSGSNGRPRQGT